MFRVLFLLFFLNVLAFGDDPVKEKGEELLTTIRNLENLIKTKPNHKDFHSLRAALASAYFKLGVKNSEGANLRKAADIFLEIAKLFRKLGFESWAKGKSKPALAYGTQSSECFLKAGICNYQLYELNKKDIKTARDYLWESYSCLDSASSEAPADSPVMMWIWYYRHLAAKKLNMKDEAKAYLGAVTDPYSKIIDLKKTLSGKSKTPWLMGNPIEAVFYEKAKQLNKDLEYKKTRELIGTFFKTCRSAKYSPDYLGPWIQLEIFNSYHKQGNPSEAGKALVKIDPSNPALNLKLYGLLKDWIRECEPTGYDRFKALPDAYRALGKVCLRLNKFEEALSCYETFYKFDLPENVIKRNQVELTREKGYCFYFLKRYEDAARSLKTSLNMEKEKKKKQDTNALQCWCSALRSIYEKSKSPSDQQKLAAAEKELQGCKVTPLNKPFALMADSSKNAYPPIRIFDGSCVSQKQKVSYAEFLSPPAVQKEVKSASKMINNGLDWLARHFDSEGYWDCDGFKQCCKKKKCTGYGHALNDAGVTGLAVLAFINAGNTVNSGTHKDLVRRAIAFICDMQDREDGCLTLKMGEHYMYNHGIAALALIKAYQTSNWPLLYTPASKALGFIHRTKNPNKAWRYNDKETDVIEQNDVSVTGWMTRCLLEAAAAGLPYYEDDVLDAFIYMNHMTDPATGRTGYKEQGSLSAREAGDELKWPFDKGEAMTSVSLYCRYLSDRVLGSNIVETDDTVSMGMRLLMDLPPKWNRKAGSIDLYYWYYAAHALAEKKGPSLLDWRKAAIKAYKAGQESKGCLKGSWDPVMDPWGDSGSRVYSTALCVMGLQALCYSKAE